jgi:uncharacterized protein DUF4932
MKKLIGLFVILVSLSLYSQNSEILKKPTVDKRVELLSIVFRLADSREYSSQKFPKYVDEIENYFGKYKNHELIKLVQKLRKRSGVSYDAVMSMAIHITQPPALNPIIPFTNEIPDERWGKKNAVIFLKLLKDFCADADCESFFENNNQLYQTASNRFGKVFNELDINWYRKFYGVKPKGEFIIVNGLGNGGANYGPKIKYQNGKESIYAIMGTWSVDSLGLPTYKVNRYFPTLLHEFNHSFVNHLTEKYKNEFQKSGRILYKELEDVLRNQGYGQWETMISEAIVRAAVIKYLNDHNSDTEFVTNELNDELNRGFLWTKELVEELENYTSNRDKYPTLESFMPEIVKFFDKTSSNINELKTKIDERRPNVVSIDPFKNNSSNVDYTIKRITVHFDRPLKGKGYSINYGKKGEKAFPEMGEITYSKDKKSVFIEVELKANATYQFVLTGLSFISKEGFGMNDYPVSFKTKEE